MKSELKLLSIGNSFSQDAQRYLGGVVRAVGKKIFNQNLYVAGCSLERHAHNLEHDIAEYSLEQDGASTGVLISIDRALRSYDWDIVTLQQASKLSFDFTTYQPYLSILAEYVRTICPHAKLMIHQTWAYEEDSERLHHKVGYAHRHDMFTDLKKAYHFAAKAVGADAIIPSGETLELLAENGFSVHRDTSHASLGIGRYALAMTWMKSLFGAEVCPNGFDAFDEPISEKEQEAVERYARMAVEMYQ